MAVSYVKFKCSIPGGSPSRSETDFAFSKRTIAAWITLTSLAGSLSVNAADLSVMVVGRDGRGVDEVVVTAMSTAAKVGSSPTLRPAVMDQKNLAFLPRVLVVAAGSSVDVPT